MKVISLNVSVPKEVEWKGESVLTSIFKKPIQNRAKVKKLNIEGDEQSDLTVHGGKNKAVYAFAAEHYTYWHQILPDRKLPWGMFGENLTIEGGLFETEVCVGDRWRMGTAELIAVQPRLPCYKLGIRFGTMGILKQFLDSERPGVYFKIVREGTIAPGDDCEVIMRARERFPILELARLLATKEENLGLMSRAIHIDHLPEELIAHFQRRMKSAQRRSSS